MTNITQTNKIEFSDMIAVIKRLTDILQEEVEMLKGMKIMHINSLQDEKLKLTSVLEGFKQTIIEHPEILNSIPQQTKNELITANNEFEKLVAEDGKQILKARKVYNIFMESIRKILDDKRRQSSVYNQNGVLGDSKKKILMATSFNLNSTI